MIKRTDTVITHRDYVRAAFVRTRIIKVDFKEISLT